MIQLFKRANDKSGSKEEGGRQKWNAERVFVKIENEYVSLSELAKVAKDNDYVSIPETVENEMELNGSVHNISDLAKKYQAKKKNKEDMDEEDDEKENEMTTQVSEGGVAGAKEDNKDEALAKAKKNKAKKNMSDEEDPALQAAKKGMPKVNKKDDEEDDEDEKENEKDEEEDVEEKIAKSNEKKDVKHFVRLNSVRENGQVTDTVSIDTMHSRVDRGRNKYGTSK